MPVYTTPRYKKDYPNIEPEINERKSELKFIIDGFEYTGKNIWEYKGDRNILVENLFNHLRKNGFPYPEVPENIIKRELEILKNYNPDECLIDDNILKNSNNFGLNICRKFCQDKFYNVADKGAKGLIDAFNDDETLLEVLRNRMGWNTQVLKDGTEQPYLFDITPSMILTGFRSSRKGFAASNFRPSIAKYLLSKYGGKSTLDLSAGWCARYLAAYSLGINYYGIDPLTAENHEKLFKYLNDNKSVCINGCSEDIDSYKNFPDKVDSIICCPPYFTLELYSQNDNKQSTIKFPNYNDWLNKYWNETIKNASKHLNKGGKFIFIMVEKYQKYNLLNDMSEIIINNGYKQEKVYSYLTGKSHLSGKKESKILNKNTEKVIIFEKIT